MTREEYKFMYGYIRQKSRYIDLWEVDLPVPLKSIDKDEFERVLAIFLFKDTPFSGWCHETTESFHRQWRLEAWQMKNLNKLSWGAVLSTVRDFLNA